MTTIDDVARAAGVIRSLPQRLPPRRRAGTIAVVVPRITRWFFATAVEAAEEALHQSGYDLLLYNLAACDEMAMGAMEVLRQRGLRVPRDVSVIGIDDHDLAGTVGLTTVAQPAAEQGRLAATLLLEPLRSRLAPAPSTLVLPTRLVARDSTAPPYDGRLC